MSDWLTQTADYKQIKRWTGIGVPTERMQLKSKPHEVQKVADCDAQCGRGIKASLLLFVPPHTQKNGSKKGFCERVLWWMCAWYDRKPPFLFAQSWRTGDKKLWSNAKLERLCTKQAVRGGTNCINLVWGKSVSVSSPQSLILLKLNSILVKFQFQVEIL